MVTASPLPKIKVGTLDVASLDAVRIDTLASVWCAAFSSVISLGNVENLQSVFINDSFLRDMLALTWDFRTFSGVADIGKFLLACLPKAHMHNIRMRQESTMLQQTSPEVLWIQLTFDFETRTGTGLGIARLVPSQDGQWRAHSVYTNLESLAAPVAVAADGAHHPTPPDLTEVLIIGGAQSGLGLAAHLAALDVRAVVVEKTTRIGDNWRHRYDSLCLHNPVYHDHLPFIPFPESWPQYTPANKFADWLEDYASALKLDVWTSSRVCKAVQNHSNDSWDVIIERNGSEERLNVQHLVFATGIGDGLGQIPSLPGLDEFKGTVIRAGEYHRATDYPKQRVVVVGSGTSAHDISADLCMNLSKVTIVQRGPTYVMSQKAATKFLMEGVYSKNGPPTDMADRIVASFPTSVMVTIAQEQARMIAAYDKVTLEGLSERGFLLTRGLQDSGYFLLGMERLGGFYIDTGASQMIIDGQIQIKSNAAMQEFTPGGVKFRDGEELAADLVIFATGCGDPREIIREVCGDEVANTCKPICGLDEEGEVRGCWRDLGIPGLWYMTGTLALSRFHSKHVALQIKAMGMGVFGPRYST